MKKHLISLVIVIFLLLPSFALAGKSQTMAIPSGGKVSFKGTSSGRVEAFCLEFHKETPTEQISFKNFSGKVKVTFADRSSRTMTIQEGVSSGYFELNGDNTYLGVKVVKKNDKVNSIEFVSDSVVSEEFNNLNSEVNNNSYKQIFDNIHKAKTRGKKQIDIQEGIVWQPKDVIFTKSRKTADGFTEVTKFGYDPDNYAQTEYFQLSGGGSLTLYKDANDDLIMIDSGFKATDIAEVSNYIQNKYGKSNLRLRIITTHPDADHINGLVNMLDNGWVFTEIITPNTPHDTQSVRELMDRLSAKQYSSMLENNESIMHYYLQNMPDGTEQLQFNELNLSFLQNRNYINPAQNDLTASSISTSDGSSIKIYKYTNATNVNDNSLVTRIEHNGVSRMDLGDAGVPVIRKLLNQYQHEKTIVKKEGDEKRLIHMAEQFSKKIRTEEDRITKYVVNDFLEENKSTIEARAIEKLKEISRMKSQPITQKVLSDTYKDAAKEFIEESPNAKILNERIDREINEELHKTREDMREQFNEELMDFQLKKLVIENNTVQLQANILQWPHHNFVPRKKADQKTMIDLLKLAKPQKIIVTTPSSKTQNKVALVQFFKNYKKKYNKNVEIIFLDEAGSQRIISFYFDSSYYNS